MGGGYYIVASRACRAYGEIKPRIIFHLYFVALLFSALHSMQGDESGSLPCRCLHDLGSDGFGGVFFEGLM